MTRVVNFLPMDSEKPPTLRSLLTRIARTVLGHLLMYVLGFGPAAGIAYKFPRTLPLFGKLYTPVFWMIKGTPWAVPLHTYAEFWFWLAGARADD